MSLAFVFRALDLTIPMDSLPPSNTNAINPRRPCSTKSSASRSEPFLVRARGQGAPVARFVEREIRAYLECGVLAREFLRVHCDGCGHDRLVDFHAKPEASALRAAEEGWSLGSFASSPPRILSTK
jgi:hypothetical protein